MYMLIFHLTVFFCVFFLFLVPPRGSESSRLLRKPFLSEPEQSVSKSLPTNYSYLGFSSDDFKLTSNSNYTFNLNQIIVVSDINCLTLLICSGARGTSGTVELPTGLFEHRRQCHEHNH